MWQLIFFSMYTFFNSLYILTPSKSFKIIVNEFVDVPWLRTSARFKVFFGIAPKVYNSHESSQTKILSFLAFPLIAEVCLEGVVNPDKRPITGLHTLPHTPDVCPSIPGYQKEYTVSFENCGWISVSGHHYRRFHGVRTVRGYASGLHVSSLRANGAESRVQALIPLA